MDGLLGLKKIGELHPGRRDPRSGGCRGWTASRCSARSSGDTESPVIVVSRPQRRAARIRALKALAPRRLLIFVAKPIDAQSGGPGANCQGTLGKKSKSRAISGPPKHTYDLPPSAPHAPENRNKPTPRPDAYCRHRRFRRAGPKRLALRLPRQLPADFPGCLLVVQHMPEGFTGMFARPAR